MVVVLFRNELRSDIDQTEYERAFERMYELAAQMPGFVSIEGFSSPDGAELAVVKFESEESLLAWKNHPEHVNVQKRAREAFYDTYRITVATEVREYEFRRPSEGAAAD
jgi:heme-degrading monooxygenase HmoA